MFACWRQKLRKEEQSISASICPGWSFLNNYEADDWQGLDPL